MNQNLSRQNLDRLLRMAGQKLGQDPQALKANLEQGNVDALTGNLSDMQKKQVGELLADREKLGQLLQSDQVKQMLDQLMKGK